MLDSVSWGELFLLGGVGVMLAGRKDLPAVSRAVGFQLGRVVGLLHGARHRADTFAHQHELKQLQNEFRSSLRELDQVKMELAMAASTQGVMGKTLGPTTRSANRIVGSGGGSAGNVGTVTSNTVPLSQQLPVHSFQNTTMGVIANNPTMEPESLLNTESITSNTIAVPKAAKAALSSPSSLPTASLSAANDNTMLFDFKIEDDTAKETPQSPQSNSELHDIVTPSERAVLEDEWHKQGIAFKSVAESGQWQPNTSDTSKATGSELLEYLQRQTLIFDQYDAAMASKDQSIQDRIAAREQQSNDNKKGR